MRFWFGQFGQFWWVGGIMVSWVFVEAGDL